MQKVLCSPILRGCTIKVVLIFTLVIDLEALAERIGDLSFKFSDCSHLPADGRRKRGDSDERESIPAKEPRIEDISSLISMIKAGEVSTCHFC